MRELARVLGVPLSKVVQQGEDGVDEGEKEVGWDKDEMELEDDEVEDEVEEEMNNKEQVDEEQEECLKEGKEGDDAGEESKLKVGGFQVEEDNFDEVGDEDDIINRLNETEDDIDISIEEADETVEDLYENETGAEKTNLTSKMEIDSGQINPALSSALDENMIMANMDIGMITRNACEDLAGLSDAATEDTMDDENSQSIVDSFLKKKFQDTDLVIKEEPSTKAVDVVQEQVENPEAVAQLMAVGSLHGNFVSIIKTVGKEQNNPSAEEDNDSDSTDDGTEKFEETSSEVPSSLAAQEAKPENSKGENPRTKAVFFCCPLCLYTVDKKVALREHLSTAHYQSIILAKFTTDNTDLSCTCCGKLCTSLTQLARHIGSKHRKLKEITTLHWKVLFPPPYLPTS